MQKIFSSVLVAMLAVSLLSDKSPAQGTGFDIGVTGGVNFATVSGDDVEDAKNLTGFMAGLSLVYPVTPMFAIQPEVAYSRKGAKGEEAGERFEIRLGYIDVPIMAKLMLGPWPMQGTPALYFSAYAAFNISCDA